MNDEIQQLILPQQLREQTLKSLHDDNGHQGLQCILDILLLIGTVYRNYHRPALIIIFILFQIFS